MLKRRPQGIVGLAWLPVLWAISVCIAPAPGAEPSPPLEYQVKAAFLLNFTRFVEWPPFESAAAELPFSICIVGDDPFGPVLDQMVAGEMLNGRRLAVQRVRRPPPAACQVLFIGKAERNVESLLSSVPPGVLTVGESDDFLREGGIVNFVVDNHRVRFDINQSSAIKAGIKLSSKLLNVARSVEK